jgi:hypothetical protein
MNHTDAIRKANDRLAKDARAKRVEDALHNLAHAVHRGHQWTPSSDYSFEQSVAEIDGALHEADLLLGTSSKPDLWPGDPGFVHPHIHEAIHDAIIDGQ